MQYQELNERLYALCLEIEKLPASEQQTKVSAMGAALMHDISIANYTPPQPIREIEVPPRAITTEHGA